MITQGAAVLKRQPFVLLKGQAQDNLLQIEIIYIEDTRFCAKKLCLKKLKKSVAFKILL